MTIGPKSIMEGKGERAQSSAEFVAIFPMLLILLFLMIEFGWLVKNYLVVTNAGREVARCAAVDLCQNSSGTSITATQLATNRIGAGAGVHGDDAAAIQFSIHNIDHDSNGPDRGDTLVVCIDSPSRSVTPLLIFAGWTGVLPNPVHLKARTEMRVEAQTGYTGADLGADPGDGSCSPN
jgi:hypothetical protein